MSKTLSKMRALGTVAIALGVGACATSLKSTIDTADNADIGQFKTYAWVGDRAPGGDVSQAPELINPVNRLRIRTSIDKELQRKGYRKVPLADADLAVSYTLGARDTVRVRNYYDDFGYRYYGFYNGFSRFGPRFGRFTPTTTVQTITEGTLAVDFFDNRRKEAIWHGAASKRLSGEDSSRQLVTEAVDTLLGQFPDSGAMADVMKDVMS